MAFEDKIEELGSGFQLVKSGQDGVFAAKADVEGLPLKCFKRVDGSLKFEPSRPLPFRCEKDKGMASSDELVSDLQAAANPTKDFDMGKKRGNLHFRLNVARVRLPVKLPRCLLFPDMGSGLHS